MLDYCRCGLPIAVSNIQKQKNGIRDGFTGFVLATGGLANANYPREFVPMQIELNTKRSGRSPSFKAQIAGLQIYYDISVYHRTAIRTLATPAFEF